MVWRFQYPRRICSRPAPYIIYKNKQYAGSFPPADIQYAFAAERKPYLPEPERLYHTAGATSRTISAGWARTKPSRAVHAADQDRLYDAQLFANYLPKDNPGLRLLPADQVFTAENFGTGTDDKFAFRRHQGNNFRYLANTILNAGFLQFDNQFQ